jgi:heat shock protein HslJ
VKPTDLDDLTPLEPDDDVLARVLIRSRSLRRRRGYQRSLTVVSSVVVIALAVGIALARVGTTKNGVSTPVPTATTTTNIAPTHAALTPDALVGSWRPVSVAGYSGPLTSPPLLEPPALRFGDYGSWSGSDGCNDATGTFQLGPGDAIKLGSGAGTKVACRLSLPFPSATARFDLMNGRLTLFADDGRQLAQYERVKISARVELPSLTMTGGSKMTGRVVVTNDTGRPVVVTGCVRYLAVALSNAHVVQGPNYFACAQGFTFPLGESSYPVSVIATYLSCGGARVPACLPNNDSPPLPPGEYQARLFQMGDAVSIPAPITVRVEPPLSSP